jgi:exopolyphosphatase/guanosine-5'-triphosphate,3'-diphosphate pyrophosphatase
MRGAVVDVGSNTVRLLLRGRREQYSRRAMLGLGDAIERHGRIPERKLVEVETCVAELAATARKRRVDVLEVLVTSPGRQAANADELVERLAAAARAPVRVLSALDEGRLAFLGAVASAGRIGARKTVAVCDVGGGSTQVVVGTRRDGPTWARSIDLGSMRLTSRLVADDPPGPQALARARDEVERYLDTFAPPRPRTALAVGGSARAIRRVVGQELDAAALAEAVDVLARTPERDVARRFGVDGARAATLPAGAVILAAVQERLGVPLRVARAGLREGALLELEARSQAA